MKNIVLILLAFFTLSCSYSQEWELIGTQDNGEELYMRPNTKNSAWFKLTPIQVPADFDKPNETIEGYSINLVKVDCKSKQIGSLAIYLYNKDGIEIMGQQIKEWDVEMENVLPDSREEYQLNSFCESNGDTYAPTYYGQLGSEKDGSDYGLRARGVPTYSKVFPDCDEKGSVVVRIIVDRSGRVLEAFPGQRGSTGDICLYDAAKKTTLTYKWPGDSKAPVKQAGFVVINYK